MISVNNIAIQFGGDFLFEEVTFAFGSKDRIGLTGLNGTGKSTLLKILAGELQLDKGNIAMPNGAKIGYLPQILNVEYHRTVFEETYTAFEEIINLEKKIKHLETEMENITDYESDNYAKILDDYTTSNDRLHALGGTSTNEKLERILKGLGFAQTDFDRKVAEMSGGWQMRIELAKLLLRAPNYVLLDEPTNHLDIESIIWLENFLKNYNGSVMMVSHDRAFLDKVCNRTIEIDLGKIYDYKANYTKYLILRKERKDKQEAAFKNQQKFVEHTETLINKFRAKKNKAKFAQTLIKKLDKLEKIEIDQTDTRAMQFRFPDPPRSGKISLEVKNLTKNYDTLTVLKDLTFTIERGEKIAFVGKNGQGKTTLSKVITKNTNFEGTCDLGHNVEIGYFAQNQAETLDGSKTVFQTLDDIATGEMRTKVRSLLGTFLFSGDDVEKKAKVLSGGEKNRLALAKLMLEPVNLLILDEPTNHLDMRSKDLLKEALKAYEGTMIIVSHDRDFLQGLTTKVYEFNNKKIKEHIGDIYAFLEKRKIETLDDLNALKNTNVVEKKKNKNEKKERIESRENKKEREKEERKLKKQISTLENKIEKLENEVDEYEAKLAEPDIYKDKANFDETVQIYDSKKAELKETEQKWERALEKLDELK